MTEKMRFQDFSWPKNPEKLRISSAKDLKEHPIPYGGAVLQDYGMKRKIITGEGVFAGNQAMETFQELETLFLEGESGLLQLPELPPLSALLMNLDLVGEATPHMVRYTFVFWEMQNRPASYIGMQQNSSYFARDGENLWSIATAHRTTVEALLKKNPQIQWPNRLREGEKVFLP